MRFGAFWQRYVGPAPTGGIVLGADAVPVGRLASPAGNLLGVRWRTNAPWGRVLVGYTYAGAGPAPALTVEAFQYEARSDAWYRLQAAQALVINTLTPLLLVGGLITNNQGPGDEANGDVYIRVIVAGGEANGTYTFVADVDQAKTQVP